MEVILKEKIAKLGGLGDLIKVKPGYARNFLIPQGKALRANDENRKIFESQRAELERMAADKLDAANAIAAQMEEFTVTVEAKAGDEGRLFGSIGARDIAEAIVKQGVQVAKHQVRLPNGVFRTTGEYTVVVHLHTDVDVELTLNIIAAE